MDGGEGRVPSFEGRSPDETIQADETPDLHLAVERAAEAASRAGYAGQKFEVAIEVIPEEHNQWIRAFSVIITGHGHA
jgi:hypothetical protein